MMESPTQDSSTSKPMCTPFDEATRRLAQGHLHQSLWLPQTSSHDRLRVTFATTSNFDQHELPVILFCGPMFGSRYNAVLFDRLAHRVGVRVVLPDRPGFGGSTPVPTAHRMQVWLEMVPLLLETLDVKHLACLASHSAGTFYCLETLLQNREILSPTAPLVALMAPWVHSEHSKMAMTTALSKLPSGVLSSWSDIVGFINLRINPTAAWSSGIFNTFSNMFQTEPQDADVDMQDKYGDEKTGKEIEKLEVKYMFAESMAGANEEARICLKSNGDGFVGACDNYQRYVEVLSAQEKERRGRNESSAKLRVSLHFAESDIMIGKGGKEYFEKCWNQTGVEEVIEVDSAEYPGTNHDSVLIGFNFEKGALRDIFEAVASAHR